MKKIAIGLPSKDESDTIGNLVKKVDSICSQIADGKQFIIINSDNSQDSKTKNAFLETETVNKKIYLHNTSVFGKGSNIKKIFQCAVENNCQGVIFFDTDLHTINDDWLLNMIKLLDKGYQAIFSWRRPIWNYGDLTYHLTYPLLISFFKAEIHQPISGEFAFSLHYIRDILRDDEAWKRPFIQGYGIDIYLTTFATNYRWCELKLSGFKDHKLRSYKRDEDKFITMRPKIQEVSEAIKFIINRNSLRKKIVLRNGFGDADWLIVAPPLSDLEMEELRDSVFKKFNSCKEEFLAFLPALSSYFQNINSFKGIDILAWSNAVDNYFKKNLSCSPDIWENIFMSRVLGFYYENRGDSNWFEKMKSNAKQLFIF